MQKGRVKKERIMCFLKRQSKMYRIYRIDASLYNVTAPPPRASLNT